MTDAAPDAGDEQLAVTARDTPISAGQAVLSGFRQPAVAVLLLIALCTAISGKPLDGVLMLTVATVLVADVARTKLHRPAPATVASRDDTPTFSRQASPASPARAVHRTRPHRPSRRRALAGLAALSAGGLYAGFVGSFSRYSWPVTMAVVAVGCLVVAVGWQRPLRQRPALTGTAHRRSWLWAAIVILGGSLELSSLLLQPHLTTDSYAHPTISALADPLLAGHPGRSAVLALWLLVGWFVVGR